MLYYEKTYMKHIALIVGTFHTQESEEMIEEAMAAAEESGLSVAHVEKVPGSIEKPLALKKLLMRDDIDGVAVLGIIERGETKHGFVMGQVVTNAVIDLQLEFMKPVGLGILGPEILPDQIRPRVRPYARKAVEAVAQRLESSL